MTHFRPAEASDIPFILGLLQEFYAKQGQAYGIPFDRPSTIITIGKVMQNGVCIVGPSSCAGLVVNPSLYNHHAKVGQVIFWYFRTPQGSKIFSELERLAEQLGATHIEACSLAPNHTIGRFYKSKKLHCFAHYHIKPIKYV